MSNSTGNSPDTTPSSTSQSTTPSSIGPVLAHTTSENSSTSSPTSFTSSITTTAPTTPTTPIAPESLSNHAVSDDPASQTPRPSMSSIKGKSTTASVPADHTKSTVSKTSLVSASLSSGLTHPKASHSTADSRLSNSTVAGVVIAASVGIALITFLLTYFIMHRRGRYGNSRGQRQREPGVIRNQDNEYPELKRSFGKEKNGDQLILQTSLPQSADDATVQQKTRTIVDLIELHVESFYRNKANPTISHPNAELAAFDSGCFPNPLATLLPQSKCAVSLIKHSLAHLITTSISWTGNPERSLLPAEFVLLPSNIMSTNSKTDRTPGFEQSLSRWRALTAHLFQNSPDGNSYTVHRDRRIAKIVQSFSRTFEPWKNPKRGDEERLISLSAILTDAADLGIWLFSQPSELQFHWPKPRDIRAGELVVFPALMKSTDEHGQKLVEPQVMVPTMFEKQ